MKSKEGGPGRNKRPMTGGTAGYTIPEAGAQVGLSRNGSYDAAARGEIPYIEFGKKKIVPRALWDRKLGLDEGWKKLGDVAQGVCADIRDHNIKMQRELNQRREKEE
jgi:hypothetical protein